MNRVSKWYHVHQISRFGDRLEIKINRSFLPNPRTPFLPCTMKELTAEERGAIIYGHKRGDSVRVIAKALGRGKTTVADIIAHYKETGSTEPKFRPGRPPLLDSPARARLKTLVTNDIEGNRRL